MMILERYKTTLTEFDAFIQRPENTDRLFEMIQGEVIEKMASNAYVSNLAGFIIFRLRQFLAEQSIAGYVTGEAGGYQVDGEPYAPDVAYLSKARQPALAREGYNPVPPELAVEIESNTTAESERRLRTKIFHYLQVGTLVWVVYAETQEVEVYTPGQPMQLLDSNGMLAGGEVLPGFSLSIKELFAI